MLRWRSLGDFYHLVLRGAGRSLVDQCSEVGSPTSEAQPWCLAGAPRAFRPHGWTNTRSGLPHRRDRSLPRFFFLNLDFQLSNKLVQLFECVENNTINNFLQTSNSNVMLPWAGLQALRTAGSLCCLTERFMMEPHCMWATQPSNTTVTPVRQQGGAWKKYCENYTHWLLRQDAQRQLPPSTHG